MAKLSLVYAPNAIFKKISQPITQITEEIRLLMQDMLDLLQREDGVGIAAPMVGVLKRIIVIDLHDDNKHHKLLMVNPKIIKSSKEMHVFKEASLCFPGIAADIKRPKDIEVSYIDEHGLEQSIEASGFLSTCIQHEMDYLDGKVYLDYLSKLKRDTLLKKMNKYIKSLIYL